MPLLARLQARTRSHTDTHVPAVVCAHAGMRRCRRNGAITINAKTIYAVTIYAITIYAITIYAITVNAKTIYAVTIYAITIFHQVPQERMQAATAQEHTEVRWFSFVRLSVIAY